MPEQTNIQRALINVDDSILIVIDVQPPFLDKLPREDSQLLRNRICWLIGVANWLHVPLVVTAEDIAHAVTDRFFGSASSSPSRAASRRRR